MKNIPDESQDVVCLFQVLHHLDVAGRHKAYIEIIKILKERGYLIIIDSFRPEDNVIKQRIWDITNRFYAVLSQYPAESLRVRFNNAMLSILDKHSYDPEKY